MSKFKITDATNGDVYVVDSLLTGLDTLFGIGTSAPQPSREVFDAIEALVAADALDESISKYEEFLNVRVERV